MASVQTAFDFGTPRPRKPVHAQPVLRHAEPEAVAPAPRMAPVSPTAWMEAKLARFLGGSVALTLTDNTRTMVSAKHRGGTAHVRLHHMFEGADELTLEAIGRYLAKRDVRAAEYLRDYVADNRDRIRRRVQRRIALHPVGRHHDLGAIFSEINARYFDDAVQAHVGWGTHGRAKGSRRRRRSIKLGSYLARGALIRVHPALDAAWVPRFFVEYIVYHEMLHHVVQAPVRGGRRNLHGAEFKARERMFERYVDALAWEREHLERLLAS